MHSTGTGQPVETQDVFFWRLAGRSAPTGLAIVHWIGCINAIKLKVMTLKHFLSEVQLSMEMAQGEVKVHVIISYSNPYIFVIREIFSNREVENILAKPTSKDTPWSHHYYVSQLQSYIPDQCPYQVSNSYTLRYLRYSLDKISKFKVTTARSKIKSLLQYDIAHLPSIPHPQPFSLSSIRFLHLIVSVIQLGRNSFPAP